MLTREQVPSILEREILPAGVALSDGALRLMQNLDPHLISTAVRVYIGNPQPLWFIGIHHCGQDIWKNIVEKIAEDPTHALFDKAWEEITSKGDGKLVAHIVETIGTSYSEKVFEQLLRHKLRANGEFMPEAWAALLALAPDPKVRSSWIECMASHANKVLDNLSEARLWLSGENLEEFLEYFAYDTNLLKLVTTIDREQILNSPEIKDSLLSLMQILFEKYPPSHYGTCDSTMTLMQQIGYSSSELSMIQECRESIMTMQLNSELAEPVEPQEIDCWIF
ncbi:hypothetical protein SAMN05421754_100268 [Nitrosomonas sp. Nm58]|nr:hypothetical protein SAMN05421754_100268 [Nitrosomonas sp. Nm58]